MIVVMPTSRPRTVHVEHVMGTVVSIDLRGAGDHAAAVADAVAWFHEVDRRFSTYRADSEVQRLGRGESADAQVSPDLAHVLAVCAAVERASAGAFALVRDGVIDPSAYVKGWSVQRAAALLREHGCEDWTVNAGGDVLVSGSPDGAGAWRIGVQHPFEPGVLATLLLGTDLAVATSGTYERGAHIVDATTGAAASGVASVTVCGPDLGLADAYSTAAFALGADGPSWLARIDGYESYTVFADGSVVATAGFPRTVLGVPVSTVQATTRWTDSFGVAA
jgi:thiamine biosynthesis lipoprotein